MDPLLPWAMQVRGVRKGREKAAVRDIGATSWQVQDSSSQSKITQVSSGDRVRGRDPEECGTSWDYVQKLNLGIHICSRNAC